jgi:hypothetical protein
MVFDQLLSAVMNIRLVASVLATPPMHGPTILGALGIPEYSMQPHPHLDMSAHTLLFFHYK